MRLETTRFGAIEIDGDAIITFTQPILGFQDHRRFVLLPGPGDSLVKWLQSTDAGDLAFIVMDPRVVVSDYRIELTAHDRSELAITRDDDIEVYTLVVVPKDPTQVRTNLRAPILINRKQRLGKQAILDHSPYPIQFYLAQSQRDGEQAQGGHACSC